MAITLPDIVQRVVLDTRKFSMGSKGAQRELSATADSAKGASDAVEKAGKAHDRAGEAAGRHETRMTRFNRAVKSGAPSVLRLADNLYKVRHGHADAAQGAERHSRSTSKLLGHLKSGILHAGKFSLKIAAIGLAALTALPVIGALGGALVALVGSMSRVIGILPALAGGFIGLLAVLGSVLLIFGGVKDAMKEQSKEGANGAKTAKAVAKAQEAGAKQIAAAQKQVIAATRAVSDARRAEAEAIANIGEVQYQNSKRIADATRRVYEAERTRAEAMAKTWTAQEKLNRSYAEAEEHLKAVRRENERANIAQQRSEMALRSTRQGLLDVLSSGTGDADEILGAMLDMESAELDAADASDALTKSNAELADADKKGVKNSDIVLQARLDLIEAKRDEEQANYDLMESEFDLGDTQRQAALDLADARQRAADATLDLADAVSSLQEAEAGVGEAQRDAAEGVADAADTGSSSSSGKAPPTKESAAIAKALLKAKEALKPIKTLVQQLTFRDVIKGIEGGTKLLLRFKGRLGETAKIISSSIATLPDKLAMAAPSIDRVWQSNNNLLDSLANLGTTAFAGMAVVADAGRFVLDRIATAADDVADRIATTLQKPETFGKMQVFFLKALDAAITWWHILRDFAVGIVHVFSAGAGVGDEMAKSIEDVAAKFREWTGDESNRKKMTQFFRDARDLSAKIWGFIKEIVVGLAGIATGPAIGAMTDLINKIRGDGSGKKSDLSDLITALGNKTLLAGIDTISGVFDALNGKKEAGTNAEKIAVAFTDLSTITDPLGTFADILAFIADKVKWGADNIPGFTTVVGGLIAVATLGKISNMTGIGGMFRMLRGGYDFVQGSRTTSAIRRINDIGDSIGAPRKVSKYGIVNRIRGVRVEGEKTGPAASRIRRLGDATIAAGNNMDKAGPQFTSMKTRLGGITTKAIGAGQAVGMVGGAVWAAGSLVGDDKLAATLNKVGAAMVFIGTVAQIVDVVRGLGSAGQVAAAGTGAMAAAQGGVAASSTTGAAGLSAYAAAMAGETVATEAATAANTGLNASLLASPITWIVIAIAALAAGLYLLYKKNDGFRKFIDGIWQAMQRAWDAILPVIKSVMSWVGTKLLGAVKSAFNWIKDHWKLLVAIFGGPIGIAVALIVTHFDTIKTFVMETLWPALQTAFGFIVDAVTGAFNFMVTAWNEVLKPVFDGIMYVIRDVLWPVFKFVFDVIVAVVKDAFGFIMAAWNTILKPIIGVVITYVKMLWAYWSFVFKLVWAVVRDVFHAIAAIWRNVLSPIFTAIWAYLKDTLGPIFQSTGDTIGVVWSAIKEGIRIAWDKISSIFKAIRDYLKDKLGPIFETLGSTVATVWDGIASAIPKAFDKAKSALKTAVRGVGNILSPILGAAATVAETIGMKNLGETLRSTSKKVANWGEEKADGGTVGHGPPEHASGHRRFGTAPRTKVGAGFKTGTPKAIVGEGSRYPEYVIPTDPKYRPRANMLIASAIRDMSIGPSGRFAAVHPRERAAGGSVPEYGIGGAFNSLVDAAKGGGEWLVNKGKGVAGAAIDEVWPRLPEKYRDPNTMQGFPGNTMEQMRRSVIDAVKGKENEIDLANALRAAAATATGGATTGLNPVFLQMFNDYNAALGNKLRIKSGWRSYQEQVALYQKYLNGTGNLAAKPGTSNHGKGLAIDQTPGSTASDRVVAKNMGLHYPVRGEDWHVEPIDKARVIALAAQQGAGPMGPPGAANTDVKKLAMQMLGARGWGGQWGALDALVSHESGWNPNAKNPSSTAYGLFQFLDSTWGAVGGAKTADPAKQIEYGFRYIAQRYSDPNGAWNFWNKNHWYAKGGMLDGVPQLSQGGLVTGDTLARIGELGRTEAVVPLDSHRGRRMLGGDDDEPRVYVDMRGMVIQTGDPEAVKAAAKAGVEEALDEVSEYVEIEL